MRLDRLLTKLTCHSNKHIRCAIQAGEISVNGEVVTDEALPIGRFDELVYRGEVLQGETARYIALNKPVNYLSANRDARHATVFDLLPEAWRDELHIVGRLDIGSSGLLLLTNDGSWAKQITQPEKKVIKRYRVIAEKSLSEAQHQQLEQGVYFAHEQAHTLPCRIEPIGYELCGYRVYLREGRYRHIRRLFGAVGNCVLALHREAIGCLELPPALASGEYCELTAEQRLAALQNPLGDSLAITD